MAKKILNVKGLRCPIPVLKAEKVLKKLKTGDILEVLTTDPQAIKDFQAFCEINNCLFQKQQLSLQELRNFYYAEAQPKTIFLYKKILHGF